jgi:hypothetical protein
MNKLKPILLLTALAALALPPAASAKDGDVRVSGKCTGSSSSKLKLGARDGRIEAELEVDQNVNGQTWRVKFKRNGKVVRRTKAKTKAPSGSFSVKRRLRDRAGTDRVVGIAKNRATGERCRAKARI